MLLACAGCGFKGPLYLPERNATVITRPAHAAPSTPNQTQTPAQAPTSKGKTPSQNPSSPQNPPSSQHPPPPQNPPPPLQ
jgi:predicted small lipoprotein YifL